MITAVVSSTRPEAPFAESVVLIPLAVVAAWWIITDRLDRFRNRFTLPRGWNTDARVDDDGTTWTPAPFGHAWTPAPIVHDWADTEEASR
jgi:hypothetical protein